jgi:hypothetical protein
MKRLSILLSLFLVACGGGGGISPTTPTKCTPPQILQNGSCVSAVKSGITLNYAKVGYYSDQQSSGQDDVFMHNMFDRFKQIGFTGVMFEITVGVSNIGELQSDLKYDRMFALIDYAHSIGLGVSILPLWSINGVNDGYVTHETLPSQFNIDTFFKSVDDYYTKNSPIFNSHRVDLIYLSFQLEDLFLPKYSSQWNVIIFNLRKNYTGFLSYWVMYVNKPVVDTIGFWSQLDAITIQARIPISNEPIYDFDKVASGYFYNLYGTSLVSEIINSSRKYNLPVILATTFLSIDHALDGGWDPTILEARQRPMPLNNKLQALAYSSLLHTTSNNLYPFISGIIIGNFEPWTYNNYSQPEYNAWGYFDLSHFPAESIDTITKYFNSSTYKISNITTGSTLNDIIYTKSGDNTIYANGGYDEINAGTGDDKIIISPVYTRSSVKLIFSEWFGNAGADIVSIYVDGLKINNVEIISDLNYKNVWSATKAIEIPKLYGNTKHKINIYCTCDNGFVMVSLIDSNQGNMDITNITNHTIKPYDRMDWIFKDDNMEITLPNNFNVSSNNGAYTAINGSMGNDSIEFDLPQVSTNFKLTKLGDLTVITDNRNIYPEMRVKNVEKIIFSDTTLSIQ